MIALTTTDDKSSELLPSNPLGQRLCEIFNYRWHTISSENIPQPQWTTHTKYMLRPRVLWRRWNDSNRLIGVRFGSTTTYAMLDIDRTSRYHPATNPDGLTLIKTALETIGIVRHVLVRSSSSGGLHLYLPLPHAVPTFGLAQAIRQCLEAQEITIAAGQVEIFPNTKAYAVPGTFTEYNAHRLPLQPDSGSCILDPEGHSMGSDLKQFFCYWDTAASRQDLETLHEAISIARRNCSKRKRRRVEIVEEWRDDLQTEMQEGWTGFGQTNHLLKTIACYGIVFEGLQGKDLAEFVKNAAINASGYRTYCRHQHEIAQRSKLWARSAEKYWWPLGGVPQRNTQCNSGDGTENKKDMSSDHNRVRAEDAQRRIREAVERLQSDGKFPADATSRVRLLVQEAHTSVQTLYRYRQLWHPGHQNSEPQNEESTEPVKAALPGGSTDTPAKDPNSLESPDSSQGAGLHSLGSNMKCMPVFSHPEPEGGPVYASSSGTVLEFKRPDRQLNHSNQDLLDQFHEELLSIHEEFSSAQEDPPPTHNVSEEIRRET